MNSKNHPIVGNSIQKLYFKHSDHDYCIMRKESFGRSSYLFVWFSSSHPPMVLFSTCQPPPAPWVNFQSIRRGWHFVQPKAAKWPECWEKTCHSLTYKHIPICNVHMHIYIYISIYIYILFIYIYMHVCFFHVYIYVVQSKICKKKINCKICFRNIIAHQWYARECMQHPPWIIWPSFEIVPVENGGQWRSRTCLSPSN